MEIACPACDTRYKVKDDAIGTAGRTVRCAKCHHSWHQVKIVVMQNGPPRSDVPNAGPETGAAKATSRAAAKPGPGAARTEVSGNADGGATGDGAKNRAPSPSAGFAQGASAGPKAPSAEGGDASAREDLSKEDQPRSMQGAAQAQTPKSNDFHHSAPPPAPQESASPESVSPESAPQEAVSPNLAPSKSISPEAPPSQSTGRRAGILGAAALKDRQNSEALPHDALPKKLSEEPPEEQGFAQSGLGASPDNLAANVSLGNDHAASDGVASDDSIYDEDYASPPRRNSLKIWTIAGVIFAAVALCLIVAVSYAGVPEWVPISRPTFAVAKPDLLLEFPADQQKKQPLPDGSKYFETNGTITNVGREQQSVPSVLIIMRNERKKIVHRWVIAPPKRVLDPGETVTIKEAVTNVPKSAEFVEFGWKAE